MSALLQISDPHFGTEEPAVAEALLAFARLQNPDVVVWSGDITQRARRSQFAAAKRFMDRMAARACLVIPGNHDIPLFDIAARLFNPYGHFREALGTELEPVFESSDLSVICLNTTRPWRHKNGEVSGKQIARVARHFRAADPNQLCIVVVHHPVRAVEASDRKNLLRGRTEAVRRWAEAGADLILGGHIHLPYACALDTDAHRSFWTVQAGTGLSHRVRGGVPNSVNLIRHAPQANRRQCTLERWDYDQTTARFGLVQRTDIPLAPRSAAPAGNLTSAS